MQYEQYVRDLQAHSRAIDSNKDTENQVSYQDLQQEVNEITMFFMMVFKDSLTLNPIVMKLSMIASFVT